MITKQDRRADAQGERTETGLDQRAHASPASHIPLQTETRLIPPSKAGD